MPQNKKVMAKLTKTQVTHCRTTLEQMRDKLQDQIEQSGQSTEVVNLDQALIGRVSRADAIQQQNVAISTRNNATIRLRKVQLALNTIDTNSYGYCKRCDETIGYPRLEAQPEANFCINCQDKADH